MLPGSATPRPAMSNAVPWSTLVRITGRPTVTLTPSSRPRTLIGPWPWSWYIATTRSKSPRTARKNAVSAGSGPSASISPATAATAGSIFSASSPRPNSPPSPACGLMPQTAMRGRVDAAAAQRVVPEADHALDAPGVDRLDRVDQPDVRGDVDHAQRRGGEHHRVVGGAGQLGEQLRVARVAVAREVQRLLVERRRADRVDLAREREGDRALDRPVRALAGVRRQLAERQPWVDQAEVEAGDRALRDGIGRALDGDDLRLAPEHLGGGAQARRVADHDRRDGPRA